MLRKAKKILFLNLDYFSLWNS